MTGAAILTALIAVGASYLAATAARKHRWIHTTTALTCALLATFATIFFAHLPPGLALWPTTAPVWVLLVAVWLMLALAAGVVFWVADQVRREANR